MKKTIIVAVSADGRGGAIYSKPEPQQVANIIRLLEKANKELEEMIKKHRKWQQREAGGECANFKGTILIHTILEGIKV